MQLGPLWCIYLIYRVGVSGVSKNFIDTCWLPCTSPQPVIVTTLPLPATIGANRCGENECG